MCGAGEDPDVFPERKPSTAIYEIALRRAAASTHPTTAGATPDALRASWVHVGDCLVNDASASKRAGARTVWLDRVAAEAAEAADAAASGAPPSGFSTASPEEVARRAAAAKEALASGAVDVRVESLDELPAAIESALKLRGGRALAASVGASARDASNARPTGLTPVVQRAATSFLLVGGACGGWVGCSVLRSHAAPRQALSMAIASGQRWGRISAAFNGGIALAEWKERTPLQCTAVGAALGGAVGSRTLLDAPRRIVAFVGLACVFETAGPALQPFVADAKRRLDSLLSSRHEQFVRQAVPIAVRTGGGAERGVSLQGRVQGLVDRLNAELGHEPRRVADTRT